MGLEIKAVFTGAQIPRISAGLLPLWGLVPASSGLCLSDWEEVGRLKLLALQYL